MKNKKQNHIELAKSIRLAWSSLDSHIDYVDTPYKKGEPKGFHKKCVKEYAEIIKTLSDQL